jgi:DnaJ family protein C protein 7
MEPSYYTNKALSLIQMKEFKKAQEECENALRVNPNFARAYQRLFKCFLSTGDFNNAKNALQKSQEIDPADANNAKDAKTLEQVLT